MKKIVKPASLLFSVLSLLMFFIIGMYFAGLIEAGKNQGLAGGAIVLGWGVIFAGIAFVLSFLVTSKLCTSKHCTGKLDSVCFTASWLWDTHYRFVQRDKLQKERKPTLSKKVNYAHSNRRAYGNDKFEMK